MLLLLFLQQTTNECNFLCSYVSSCNCCSDSISLISPFQELKESFNYGLFCPPSNGKAGKFLDEERRLGDYPFNGPVGYLEVCMEFFITKYLEYEDYEICIQGF